MTKIFVALVIVLVFMVESCQQTVWDAPKYQKITVEAGDSIMNFRITDEELEDETNKRIFWYQHNQIQISTGGYSGKLLNGEYMLTDQSGGLITKGFFEKGLKTGNWVRWDDGQLVSEIIFDKGEPSGAYKLYQKGTLKESGTMDHGVKEGLSTIYYSDTTLVKRYKNGVVLLAKPKESETSSDTTKRRVKSLFNKD